MGCRVGCGIVLHGGLLQESLELVNVVGALGVRKAFQGVGTICNGCHEFVRGIEAGVGDVFVVELDGIAESLTVGGFDVTAVCTVVFCRGILRCQSSTEWNAQVPRESVFS